MNMISAGLIASQLKKQVKKDKPDGRLVMHAFP
jgi:hypothetical protein